MFADRCERRQLRQGPGQRPGPRATAQDNRQFADDPFTVFHQDNPRIMLIPLVTYLGDTGTNAEFRIEVRRLLARGINRGQKVFGRFISMTCPEGTPATTSPARRGLCHGADPLSRGGTRWLA